MSSDSRGRAVGSVARATELLDVLAASDAGLGVNELARRIGVNASTASRLLATLQEAGLVTRRPNPADRRGVQLAATAKGSKLLERRARIGNAWLAEQLSALSKADRLAVERAVALLESFATERPGEAPEAPPDRQEPKETGR